MIETEPNAPCSIMSEFLWEFVNSVWLRSAGLCVCRSPCKSTPPLLSFSHLFPLFFLSLSFTPSFSLCHLILASFGRQNENNVTQPKSYIHSGCQHDIVFKLLSKSTQANRIWLRKMSDIPALQAFRTFPFFTCIPRIILSFHLLSTLPFSFFSSLFFSFLPKWEPSRARSFISISRISIGTNSLSSPLPLSAPHSALGLRHGGTFFCALLPELALRFPLFWYKRECFYFSLLFPMPDPHHCNFFLSSRGEVIVGGEERGAVQSRAERRNPAEWYGENLNIPGCFHVDGMTSGTMARLAWLGP